MLPITLRQFEYLVAVADSGTIAGAAEQCQVSAVAVGQGLAELDRILGTELTTRRRAKGVTLTPAGEVVAARARKILREIAQLPSHIDAETRRRSRKLRIGVFTSLSTWVIPPLMKFFATEHPDVELEYLEGDIVEMQKSLDAGNIDLFVANRNQLREITGELQMFPVREVKPYVLVAEHHRLSGYPGVRFSDLTGEDFVLLGLNPAYQRMMEILTNYGLGGNVRWQSRNVETVSGIVGSGLAIALQFSFGTNRTSLDGEKLISVPVLDPMPANVAVACIPAGMEMSPTVHAAVEHLRELYQR